LVNVKGDIMPTISEINHEIMQGSFTNDQLNAIASAIKYRRAQLTREVKRSITLGTSVKFYHPKLGKDIFGTVDRVKQKFILVQTLGGRYNVPANLLERV
jgi:hypothetical protein